MRASCDGNSAGRNNHEPRRDEFACGRNDVALRHNDFFPSANDFFCECKGWHI
jgi:hypothetical protein